MNTNTSISIVICTYNGAERIEKVLSCFNNQVNCEEIEWEIVVVDNNSSDNTYETVQKLSSEFGDRLKLVQETKQGLIHARIKGYQSSKYNVISYIDDDNYVANNWISNVYHVMNMNENIGASGGYNELYVDKGVDLPSWFEEFQNAYAIGGQSELSEAYVEHLWGSGLSIRRTILDILFTDSYSLLLNGRTGEGLSSGEDSEIVYAVKILNWKLFYTENLKLQHHINHNRFSFVYLEKLYKAFGASQVDIVPYMYYMKNNFSLHNSFKYSPIWQVVYMINSMKVIYYSLIYTLNIFNEKKKQYKLLIVFILAANKELYKRRDSYKEIFMHVKKLLKFKRK